MFLLFPFLYTPAHLPVCLSALGPLFLPQGMGHIETSAKDGTGVEVAMQAVAMLALDQKRKRERELALNPSLGGGTTLDLADERARQQRKNGCCW